MRSIEATVLEAAGAALVALWLGCSRPTPATATAQPTPVEVHWWGSLREMMHQGRVEALVELAAPLATPHLYAIGALAGMRGEITTRDGTAWLAFGERDDGRAKRGRARSGAAGGRVRERVAARADRRGRSFRAARRAHRGAGGGGRRRR
jgi:hypothetical protein